MLAGTAPDTDGTACLFWATYAAEFWRNVAKDFDRKSVGRAGEFGDKWKPLKRETIAQRPIARGEVTKLGIGGRGERALKNRVRGLLTKSQDAKWRAIFRSIFVKQAPVLGEDEAKRMAAKIAWTILKREGAQTKLAVLGGRKVKIGVVTGELRAAVQPGRATRSGYRPPKGQTYEQGPKSVEMAITVEHAEHFDRFRRIFPAVKNLITWQRRAARKAIRALA